MKLMFIILTILSVHAENLPELCQRLDGVIVESWECPKSGVLRKGSFCQIKDSQERVMTTNGCTGASFGPMKTYGEFFIKSCVKHDLCYHHEPATSGIKKQECDETFLLNMKQECLTHPNQDNCLSWASIFYTGVKRAGMKSWSCSDEEADYTTLLLKL